MNPIPTAATGLSSNRSRHPHRSAVQMGEGRSCAVQMGACPALASLPDDDDILLEFLLRLPPLPSSLPRAALVCKRWRRLLSDPQFLRRFRAHHRTPPMLGFFKEYIYHGNGNWVLPGFTPTLATPDRIPRARFSFPKSYGEGLSFLGCRHGLALLFNKSKLEAVVWDPVTGCQHRIALPPKLKDDNDDDEFDMYHGAVLRNCCSRAFKVVMVHRNFLYADAWACLYDSETENWGNIISTMVPKRTCLVQPSVLFGNTLCWLLDDRAVLQFDTDRQSLDCILMPGEIHVPDNSFIQVLRTVDGGLGLAILSEQEIQLWGRNAISDHVAGWVLQKTIELDMDKLISLRPSMNTRSPEIVGYDEDNNVIFIWTTVGVFMIELESTKVTSLSEDKSPCSYYPYTSFYTAGLGIGGGDDRAEVLKTA